jgi:hypothetical protein
MRKMTTVEHCVGVAWMLFMISCGIFGLSSKVYEVLLSVIYENANYPRVTEAYLMAYMWCWIPPFVALLILWYLWRKTPFDRTGTYAMVIMHFGSVIIMIFMFYAIIKPFLSTTWHLG